MSLYQTLPKNIQYTLKCIIINNNNNNIIKEIIYIWINNKKTTINDIYNFIDNNGHTNSLTNFILFYSNTLFYIYPMINYQINDYYNKILENNEPDVECNFYIP